MTSSDSESSASSVHLDFWPRLLLFPSLAVFLYPPFVLGWGGDSFLVRAAWVLFLAFCWFCLGGAFHEAVHQTLFRRPSWNLWTGRMMGMLCCIPYTAFRETHRWHHAYLNTPGDYELWPYSDPGCSLAFRRVFVWIDLFGGVLTAPYIYGRIYFKPEPRLRPEVLRTISREYVAIAAFWTVLTAAIGICGTVRGFDWSTFDPVWLLPVILGPVVNTGRKLVEHLGMTSCDPILGTRTIVATNPITRIACFFNFDIAVHGPHHRFPRAAHYELAPRLADYEEQNPEIPVPRYGSYSAAVRETIPCLWRNPATGQCAQGDSDAQGADAPLDFESIETASPAVFAARSLSGSGT